MSVPRDLLDYLSVYLVYALWRIGIADPKCLCDHPRSIHNFDPPTPQGFCENGDFREGCSCMLYEIKGLREIVDRH